ncbi:UbiA prenyltransferase family-domain-containing protein [Diaporthe sp. PMI_573]|nr:UbiA prenyltransferase family-domain-containing protein [Diaporthaceae sp. PMI_573]
MRPPALGGGLRGLAARLSSTTTTSSSSSSSSSSSASSSSSSSASSAASAASSAAASACCSPLTRPFLPHKSSLCWQPSRRLVATRSSYFSPNVLLDASDVFHKGVLLRTSRTSPSTAPAGPTTAPQIAPDQPAPVSRPTAQVPPHRQRQAARRAAAAEANPSAAALPENASGILTSLAASQPANSLRRRLSALLSLSKPRLTVLVVLTAMVPYALYPVPAFLSASLADTPSLSPLTLLFLTTGTTLCSASANALNMLYEPSTDAKMSRTRNRPLVRNLLSTRAAVLFAAGCGLVGTAALYWGVNPTVAFLGAANIALYAGVYTPMKGMHWLNTWVGALVGGIPPLMGWAAAAGESATADGTFRELLFKFTGDGTSSVGGWLLAGLLFAWQFPHFMALSWAVRDEYKNAGLKMLCWLNPARNGRVALRYSLVFIPICVGLCAYGVTEWTFAATSLPVNLWLVREALKFHRFEGHKGSARGLFWASVWHLPAVMGLALLQKKGMWQRVWASIVGEPVDQDEWEDIDDEVDVASVRAPARLPVRSPHVRDESS